MQGLSKKLFIFFITLTLSANPAFASDPNSQPESCFGWLGNKASALFDWAKEHPYITSAVAITSIAATIGIALRPSQAEQTAQKEEDAALDALIEDVRPKNNTDVVTVFAHGLGADKHQGAQYHYRMRGLITTPLITFNFQDADNIFNSCLGQNADIESLRVACSDSHNILLNGLSRGGSTIINFLAAMNSNENPQQFDLTKIKAVVVESPFAHVKGLIAKKVNDFASYMPGKTSIASFIHSVLFARMIYRNYNPDGVQPIDSAQKMPKDIPILLVCSKEDTLIPPSSTVEIFVEMLKAGHPKVHLLILDHGKHAGLLWAEDRLLYKDMVYAFYDHYKVEAWSQNWTSDKNRKRFALCSYTLEAAEQLLKDLKEANL